ncbi:potassium-transporting ATPase KdpC subunit [Kushneria pakistanensis]|uniref:Potassium-transporting ATPase KdpC subunit n=1 Tax=Kushneria pakistanensis TaxID=1508770 RepID=A0ABQ3FGZ8_9GAMM|nr:potassium-transporting ATPase subunit KdpC [Kushneria pakistanensis]GHC23073.1 potassium-transporting ATPase KdpC subunit [Kushneria pakistanensis]
MNDALMIRPVLFSSLRLMVVLAALLGLVYPFVTTTLGGALFPFQAGGSVLHDSQGRAVGSALVGQSFEGAQYFHGRPSAVGNDPVSVGGSNLAPGNVALRERAQQEAERLAARDGLIIGEIPVELLAASGSGVDPHISPAAARVQAARVSQARGLSLESVMQAIAAATEYTGFPGAPVVNVLRLNLALAAMSPAEARQEMR